MRNEKDRAGHLELTISPSEMRTEGLHPKGLKPNEKDRAECKTARMALSPFSFLLYKSHMSGIYSVLLLVLSNIFMTFAWYGHLKLSETGISKNWPLIAIIAFSWGIAFFEYVCQVPANRIGFIDNGGPFTLIQLKVIQEVVSLLVFTVVVTMLFKGETFHWNHIAAFACLVAAVYFVFMK